MYVDNGIGAVPTSGSCLVTPAHTTAYCITACGPHGSARARAVIVVEGTPEVLPEGSFGARYQDLVPADATLDSYDSRRFSIVRGMVVAGNDAPLSGVAVTIHDRPEYGTAYTDDNGFFSIPVEGGGVVVLAYYKEEFCSAQRKVFVPWNDVVAAESIRMIARDPRSTTFTFDGNPATAVTHQSSVVTDESGSRACSIVFTGDNRAYMTDEAGNDIFELATIRSIPGTVYLITGRAEMKGEALN